MRDVVIDIASKGPIFINDEINIEADINIEEDIKYKFMEGYDKVWTPIQDFSTKNICKWKPKRPGKYMIMVQCKVDGSSKPYDFLGRAEIDVNDNEKLIEKVNLEKNKLNVGDKTTIYVENSEEFLLYRFWIKGKGEWELLRDYTGENSYTFTATKAGIKEILVECKRISSENNVDDFVRVKIEVNDLSKIEITNFQCLSNRLITNEELFFKVETNYENNRPILYKFVKINSDGRITSIQDFSSKNSVSLKEEIPGKYKLLCMVRDIFSNKEFDDRAVMTYEIEPYEKIKIRSIKTDLEAPQAVGTPINLKADVVGGRELLYRYIIEGNTVEDSGFSRSPIYLWKPIEEGKYTITLKVKDISFKGDYEDIASLVYKIDKKADKPVRIIDLQSDKGKKCLTNQSCSITAKTDGGSKVLYKFIFYKDGVQYEEKGFSYNNGIDFTPKEKGEYEIEVRAKDFYSNKEYDSVSSIYIKASDFLPINIDCILVNSKENYLVNDTVELEAIIQNTEEAIVKFITKINGQEVENTGFVNNKALRMKPKCSGKYTIEVYAKNLKSSEEYDSKKEISIFVNDSIPINSTKVLIKSNEIKIGKEITFEATSIGGKDKCYQFYIMKDNNWVLVQGYGKKNYYTFIPFVKGEYRLLVLVKSFYKKAYYEDYNIITFNVSE